MDLNKIYSFYNNYLKKRILKIILFSLAFALLILNVINNTKFDLRKAEV